MIVDKKGDFNQRFSKIIVFSQSLSVSHGAAKRWLTAYPKQVQIQR